MTVPSAGVEPVHSGVSRWSWSSWMDSPPLAASGGFFTWAWRYFLAHLVFRYVIGLLRDDPGSQFWGTCSTLMGLALALSFAGQRWELLTKAVALTAASIEMISQFPINSNHSCLEYVLLVAFVLVEPRQAEQRALLVALGRWFCVWVMFYSGLQKIIHGAYFNGSYLAAMANDGSFSPLLRVIAGAEEYARLSSELQAGSEGPYHLRSALGLIVSNAVYLSELAVGLLLFSRSLRVAGAIAGLIVIFTIEVVAHELTFGLLFVNLLFLYLPVIWRKRAAVASVVAYVGLLIAQVIVGKVWFFV